EKHFAGRLAATLAPDLLAHYDKARERLEQGSYHARHYERCDFAQMTRDVMHEADYINGLIAEWQPWKLAKNENEHSRLQEVCTLAINFFRLLAIYLKPIVPATGAHVEIFLDEKLRLFDQAK